jgi:osmotically inducible lipoprotein OsmB
MKSASVRTIAVVVDRFSNGGNEMSKTIIVAVLAAGALAACSGMSRNEKIGTAGGAVLGGAAGSAATGGSTAGTVGGAVVGGAIGDEIGDRRDERQGRR